VARKSKTTPPRALSSTPGGPFAARQERPGHPSLGDENRECCSKFHREKGKKNQPRELEKKSKGTPGVAPRKGKQQGGNGTHLGIAGLEGAES